MPNCIRFFPTQAFNFAFKDRIKRAFPKYTETHKKLATNVAAGAAAGAGARHLLPHTHAFRTPGVSWAAETVFGRP